jgi:Xrn1 helical domain
MCGIETHPRARMRQLPLASLTTSVLSVCDCCAAAGCRGCVSWEWFFPFHYVPMISDLTGLSGIFNKASYALKRIVISCNNRPTLSYFRSTLHSRLAGFTWPQSCCRLAPFQAAVSLCPHPQLGASHLVLSPPPFAVMRQS